MKYSKAIIGSIIAILFVGNLHDIEAQDETNFPLLYYYSIEQQAFVIEDVLGNNSNKLIDFQLCNSCWITGAGWSPSGEWFTWGTELVPTSASPHDNEHIYVTDYAGTEFLPLTSEDQRSRNAQWSPQADLLLYEVYNVDEFFPSQYIILDTSSNEQIWTWDIEDDLLTDISWTQSGEIVIYTSTRSLPHQATMTVYSLDTRLILERDVQLDWQADGAICKPTWSEENQVVYMTLENQLVIEDIVQQEQTVIEIDDTYILSANASPNNKYLILYTSDECNPYLSTTASALLISWTDRLIMETFADALFIPTAPLRSSISSWSPDSHYWTGIIVNDDVYEQYIADIETYLPETIQEFSIPEYPFVVEDTLTLWKSESELIYFTQGGNRINVSTYNIEDSSRNIVANLEGIINSPTLSPDGSQLALGNLAECNGVCIVNISENVMSSITTQFSDIEISESAEEIIWHQSNVWYFILARPIGSARSINIGSIHEGVVVER